MSVTIPLRFLDRAAQQGDRTAFRLDSTGETFTWGRWRDRVLEFAAALTVSEASQAEAVAILAGNGAAWPIADLATLISGKTSVGIYPTSASVQIEKILADSSAGLLVVDDPRQLESVLPMRDRLPALRVIVAVCESSAPGVISWSQWLQVGAEALRGNAWLGESIESGARVIGRDDPAIIIYTSGSTGEPKGAVLSHGCIDASAASIQEALGLRESDTTLSFLPFSHAAERITGLYTRIRSGMEALHVENAARMWEVTASYKPTMYGGLPRYYEKLLQAAHTRKQPASEILGGRVRLATSGGAALSIDVARALAREGVTVLGAYGLTEHLCVAFNRPDDPTFETSGSPMPGTEIRIAMDGEVLVRRSELTFSGYHNQPEATRASFTADGEWLHTGDLGSLDEHGRLKITGRKKELLALSNGKMVAPIPIEERLARHPLIAHAVLHAEGKQFVSALIALNQEALEAWAKERGIDGSHEAMAAHPRVEAEIQKAVDEVNSTLSRAEGIRRFVTIGRELSIAASELTPTHKVRRKTVLEKFAAQLEALYS